MRYSEFKHQSVLTRIFFFKKTSYVVLSQIFPSPSFCLSQIMWFIKLYMFIYPGFGFVIGFRFEDLVFSDVATCNLMEVYGNFRGITGSNHLDR